jgi:signal transduction histidine kinase
MIYRTFPFLVIFFWGMGLYAQDLDLEYSFEEIEAIIEQGRVEPDFGKLARGYYLRGLSNAKVLINQDKVTEDLRLSTTYFKFVKDSLNYYKARTALANVFIEQGNYFDEALEMLEESEAYYQKNGHARLAIRALTSISLVYEQKQEYQTSLKYIHDALELNKEEQDTVAEIRNAITIANLFHVLGKTERAIEFAEKNLEKCKLILENELCVEIYYQIGTFHERLADYEKALELYNIALLDAKRGSAQLSNIYFRMGETYAAIEEHPQAFEYQRKFSLLNDSILNQQKVALTTRLSLEYQTIEKEKAISQLQREQQLRELRLSQQKRLSIALLAFIIAGIVAIFYVVRFYRQKIKVNELISIQRAQIDKQKIQHLETDIKIQSLEAMVDGQEVERHRIATDLHDSLGGMLSTVKLQFDALQYDHKKLAADKDFNKLNRMIDDACSEVRKIARNLKPSALENMGLEAAIRDLINRYQSSGNLEISFHCNKIDGKLSLDSKLHLYRIIQELLNNAIKHSEAGEIDIQLNRQNGHLMLKVEDDGIGFKQDEVEMGLGLGNIRSRVNVLKGDMSIDSQIDAGTSIIIDFPVKEGQKN